MQPTKAPNGSGYVNNRGYREMHYSGRRVLEHIVIAERALGKRLPAGAVVHHVDENRLNNTPTNLVVCPDDGYHKLIHRRMRAIAECGQADWIKCGYCHKWDHPSAYPNRKDNRRTRSHRLCAIKYQRERRAKKSGSVI